MDHNRHWYSSDNNNNNNGESTYPAVSFSSDDLMQVSFNNKVELLQVQTIGHSRALLGMWYTDALCILLLKLENEILIHKQEWQQ